MEDARTTPSETCIASRLFGTTAVQHVDLTESDLRRLGDLWPLIQGASDERNAADLLVARASDWLTGRLRCERLLPAETADEQWEEEIPVECDGQDPGDRRDVRRIYTHSAAAATGGAFGRRRAVASWRRRPSVRVSA